MMRLGLLALCSACCFATIAAAQQPSAASVPPPPAPDRRGEDIVVVAAPDPDAPDLANQRKTIIVGSRIPRHSTQNNPLLATRTSLNGFTPGSGMDPYKDQRTIFWKSCRADGAVLRKPVACALAGVQKLIAAGKIAQASTAAARTAALPDLTGEERFAIGQYQYRLADMTNDGERRHAALETIVATDLLPVDEQASAVRTLASAAWHRNDQPEALERFQQAARLDPGDANSRVNAAAMLQSLGRRDEARQHLRAAIAIVAAKGQPVPQSWIDNAR